MWTVRRRLDQVVTYVANVDKTLNPEFESLQNSMEYIQDDTKTEKRFYVTGINCSPETGYKDMLKCLRMNDKQSPILAYHGYQSFVAGEVDAQTAHAIGVALATELWGDRYCVLVGTHLNTGHFHNHLLLCPTSFVDGRRYHNSNADIKNMRKTSDRLCAEHSLSVIENPKSGKTKQYGEWKAEQEGKPTWRSLIKTDVDEAIAASMVERQFFYNLKAKGYEIKMGKDISVRPAGKERFFRLERNFGKDYSYARICERILSQPSRQRPMERAQTIKSKSRQNSQQFRPTATGLHILFLHYTGLLQADSRAGPNNARMHFLLREDLIKLDAITKETQLLGRENIQTAEQLGVFKQNTQATIQRLIDQRSALYRQKRKTTSVQQSDALKGQISDISKQLKTLRGEVRLCDGIAMRSCVMEDKLNFIDNETQGRKVRKDDPISRRRRTDR
jgi:hypothetical protein